MAFTEGSFLKISYIHCWRCSMENKVLLELLLPIPTTISSNKGKARSIIFT